MPTFGKDMLKAKCIITHLNFTLLKVVSIEIVCNYDKELKLLVLVHIKYNVKTQVKN